MSQVKNPSTQNYDPKQKNSNENNRSQEVELPIPEKKNDIITTNTNSESEKIQEKAGKISNDTDQEQGNEKLFRTGFDVNNTGDKDRIEKRGDEKQKLERDDTTQTKTQDARWQQDKMNEANNQQGSKQNIEKAAKLHDTREDSILDRPKTETYEKNDGDNVGGKINKDNYTHSSDEKKRDDNNRKNNQKTANQK